MKYQIFLVIFFKLSQGLCPEYINHWLVFDVGQGQWVTHVQFDQCSHFDFGGELFKLKQIRPLFIKHCRNKLNLLYLSHADWDHYSFYNFIVKNSQKVCWKIKPQEPLKKINQPASLCSNIITNNQTHVLFYDQSLTKRNESSTVLLKENVLIPGDSPSTQEKSWAHRILPTQKINRLIIGHHGSRSSTSDQLLKQLPHLQMAIASSRFKRYGHPHKNVTARLKKYHLNIIRTEDWGNILMD